MKNLSNILSKIEKVELAEVNVELGLIQDIDKKIESNKKESQKGFDFAFDAKGLLTQAITSYKFSVSNYTTILGEAEKVKKSITDLGLSENEINDKISLLNRYIKDNNDRIQVIQKALSSL